MPQLTDLLEKRKGTKFVKKNYRPWNLSGDPIAKEELNNKPEIHSETIETSASKNSTKVIEESTSIDQQKSLVKEPREVNIEIEHRINAAKLAYISDAELGNEKVTIREQLDNEKVTIREQLDNEKVTIREQLDNEKVTIRERLNNEFTPLSIKIGLTKLSGLQGKIFTIITNICLSKGGYETGPIDTAVLATHLEASIGSTKTSLNRLLSKGFIIRKQGKRATGGYINLGISQEVMDAVTNLRYQPDSSDILKKILLSNNIHLDNKLGNNSVYSSSNINTTTKEKDLLSPEWLAINIEPLAHIGFTKNQLKQVVGLNTPEVVQESILHFAYALEHNTKYKDHNSPLNVIMGVLRKGQGWFEASYESPQDKALRELIEQRKKQKERREKLIEDFVSSSFDEWLATLSKDQIDQILPKEISSSKLQAPKTSFLKSYYKENIVLPELTRKGQL